MVREKKIYILYHSFFLRYPKCWRREFALICKYLISNSKCIKNRFKLYMLLLTNNHIST